MKLIHLHVGMVHNHELNFNIICGLNSCKSSFTVYESFRCHVYHKHRKLESEGFKVIVDGIKQTIHGV